MNNLGLAGNPELNSERLKLRKLEIKDIEDVYQYGKDPVVTKYMTFEPHKSIEDAKAFVNLNLEMYSKGETGSWGIELKETGKLIGAINFGNIDYNNFKLEVGYALSRVYWNKGYMTEVLKHLIQFIFEETNFNRIEAFYNSLNPASGRVMEKAGLNYEGLSRQKVFIKNSFWDVVEYAIIKEDWNK